jgi:hypothetical protein
MIDIHDMLRTLFKKSLDIFMYTIHIEFTISIIQRLPKHNWRLRHNQNTHLIYHCSTFKDFKCIIVNLHIDIISYFDIYSDIKDFKWFKTFGSIM